MRILERIAEVYAIGDRPGYGAGEDRAHELAARWMEEAGLAVEVDADGNLIGSRGKAGVWTGSHLDAVPNGGRFDGVLGVLAGIEAAERLPRAPLAVVAFRDEERGFGGSIGRVAHGGLPEVYLELHIEQGPVLLRAGRPLAAVSRIVGLARGEVVFSGAAGHAGTTPMEGRRDALVDAAAFVLRVRDAARAIPDAVATVGELTVDPGASNVVPDRVTLSVDARAPDRERLDRLVAAIGFEPNVLTEPAAMDEQVRAVLRECVDGPELVSGAGHDAGVLAGAGVRCGMLFVRSQNDGVSHSPDELTTPEDIALAVDVLTAALSGLAE